MAAPDHDNPKPFPGDLRLPSIDGLRAFEAVARLRNFERAAEALHVTASAISKRINALEGLLGTRLFDRSGKSLVLTVAGKEYLEQVRAALSLLANVPLHHRPAQRLTRLRVTSPPTFARQVLVPHLGEFTAAHPDIELEVVLSIPFLEAGPTDADVEVRNGDPHAHGTPALMADRVLPVAAPALLQRLPPIQRAQDLRAAPLLRTPLEAWTPWFRAAGLDWPEPRQGPKLVDLGLVMEAAISGQGVALVRPTLALNSLRSGALLPVWPLTAVPANLYYLLPHATEGAPAVFARWLRTMCARVADEAQAALAEILSRRG